MKKILLFLIILTSKTLFSLDNSHQNDAELKKIRKALNHTNTTNDVLEIDPLITTLKTLTKEDRYGVCHDYAISKILDIEGQLSDYFTMVGCRDWYDRFNVLENYFEEIAEPKKGDLVIYRDTRGKYLYRDPEGSISHTGLVYDEGLVESKWGRHLAIFIHPTFHTPNSYKNNVRYYRQTKSNKEIIDDLQKKISHDKNLKNECKYYNEQLLNMTNDRNYVSLLFDWIICTDVNTTNKIQQTPLHLAAKSGNKDIAETFIEYGADVNKKDQYGNTPLHTATYYNHKNIAELLIKKGADISAKNNANKTASYFEGYNTFLGRFHMLSKSYGSLIDRKTKEAIRKL